MARYFRGWVLLMAGLHAATAMGQLAAYDEFDGRTRAGWAEAGLGPWGKESGPGEVDGALRVVSGNSWRRLAAPVKDATVWYAVTLAMTAPIHGYASVVPASSTTSQYSELGFNTGFGRGVGLWTGGGGPVFSGIECTRVQTFLQRYDLAEGVWSAWAAEGDGMTLLGKDGRTVEAAPLVKDAPLGARSLSHLYLTKGSAEVLEIHRVALAGTAAEALTPVKPGAPVGEIRAAPPAPPSPGVAALVAEGSGLRTGERIAFFGDSVTWQGGYIELLERSLARHAASRHVTLIKRGINGGKSTDLRDGVKDLYGQTQAPMREVLAADRPSVVVIMIGINDVWHGEKGNPPAAYREALAALAAQGAEEGRRVVLCTPTVIGEKRGGANPLDARLDEYTGIVRELAASGAGELCDMRRAFAAAEEAGNADDAEKGFLTYDGVHMLPRGNELLAEEMAAAVARAVARPDPAPGLPLIPAPLESSRGATGRRVLPPTLRLAYEPAGLAPQAAVLAGDLATLAGVRVAAVEGVREPAEILLAIDASLGARGPEMYTLSIPATGMIEVRGATPRGVAWGCVSLLQLLEKGALPAPAGVTDGPAMAFRGVELDVARQPHSIRSIKQVVEVCRMAKAPYLQLHLTDDQSFTFPSEAFPALPTPGRSYTRGELAELRAFAGARGVTIIPEVEMPGHAGQMVSRMPGLFRAHEKHHATVNFASPAGAAALETLVGEVCDVFADSPYIHIGGDEADLAFVHESPDFKAAFEREGVTNAHDLYLKFLTRMNGVVKARGRRMMVWEGFGPGAAAPPPKDIIVQAFESAYYRPDALVRDGYTIINASWQPLYVVNKKHWTPREILAWNPWLWEHFLERMPSYRGIQLAPGPAVMGALLCSWEQPEASEVPSLRGRAAAMSERAWAPGRRGSFEEFEGRWRRADAVLEGLISGR